MAKTPNIPITRESDGSLRWKSKPVSINEFSEIRNYVDHCLKPETGLDNRCDLEMLCSDYRLLLELIEKLGTLIKDPIESELVAIEKRKKILAIPRPLKPKTPIQLQSAKGVLKATKVARKELHRLKLLLASSGIQETSKRIVVLEKFILTADEQFADFEEWKLQDQQWLADMAAARKLPASLDELVKSKHKDSTFKIKVLSRIKNKLLKIIDSGLMVHKVNWKILPSEHGIRGSILNYIELLRKNSPERKINLERFEKITSLKPDYAYSGHDEFNGYIVFIFSRSKYAILECPWYGNALYLLPKNLWGQLSKYSRTQLLDSDIAGVKRIIHDGNSNWFNTLKEKTNL